MSDAAPADLARYRLVDCPAPWRRGLFFLGVLMLAAVGIGLMTRALAGNGLRPVEIVLIVLFGINFVWISLSFMTGLVGLVLRLFAIDPASLKRIAPWPPARGRVSRSRTVVVMPVYNEEPERVFAGIRAMIRSLGEIGQTAVFDFFVLSDTRDPDIWISEELLWAEACRRRDLPSRVFYRRREHNPEKKAGNLKDFCENWGSAYDFMIVLDADSILSGEAMVHLVRHMEASPDAGIIQSPPVPVGRGTLFARIQQFISRVHGPTMARGLAFWQLGNGNYWGHNAIIRTAAFIDCCGLPVLPGKPPLGGPILSHDFVEAALMRRGGWRVWMVADLDGSWEELPPNIVDYAIRDRRWCQGNLQHLKVLGGRGLSLLSRLHLFMGVMSFLSSLFWLGLLLISTLAAIESASLDPQFFESGVALFPSWPLDRRREMLILLLATLAMLVLPKLLSLLLVLARRRRLYGGAAGLLAAGVGELLFAALLAPVMMLLHSGFVIAILAGRAVGWDAQSRGERTIPLAAALHVHRRHVLAGILWGSLALYAAGEFFLWLLPVLLGLLLAPVLTHGSSRLDFGAAARRLGMFVTPAESDPPAELRLLDEEVRAGSNKALAGGLQRLLEDPQASALHAALLPERAPDERTTVEISILYEKLARLGAESLSEREKMLLLSWPVRPLDQIRAGRPD